MKVYLSGGMRSGWQDIFKAVARNQGITCFDPRDHGLVDAGAYVKKDLEWVKESDLVMAYLESSNDSGVGLSVELGYAKALGKEIWLVCEKFDKKWDFIRALADAEFKTVEIMLGEFQCR